MKVIDSSFILNVEPNWSHGRNHGFTDDETERIAEDTYWEMERFYEKCRPHKWPDEKPEADGEYLARLDTGDDIVYKVLYIVDQYTPWTNYVTHWWNLPEVTE